MARSRTCRRRRGILKTPGTFGLGVAVFDFDNDGWPDIYVANDSTSSALYKNNHDGTFQEIAIEAGVAYSADGKPQAGMGVSVADYDGDGNFDLVKTNFAGDTTSLYRNLGGGTFDDQTFQAGLGKITRFLGWGIAFVDYDNDGWPDIVQCNGHVYPEVGETLTESGYRQRKVVYRNLRNGKFQEVSEQMGPGIMEKVTGRGMAVGDFDNDGDLDLLVNCVNDVPQLLRCDSRLKNHWIKVKTVGTKSNRTGIGARIYCTTQEAESAPADGRGAQRRQLHFAERSASALRIRRRRRWPIWRCVGRAAWWTGCPRSRQIVWWITVVEGMGKKG